jgi:hypothetical protein
MVGDIGVGEVSGSWNAFDGVCGINVGTEDAEMTERAKDSTYGML